MGRTARWAALALLGMPACLAPLAAPSAFEDERFLCGQEHLSELDARVAECRQARLQGAACDGYMSVQGVVDSQPTVVDAPVMDSFYVDDAPDSDGVTWRNQFVLGLAPYFKMVFRVSLVVDAVTGQLSSRTDLAHPDFLNLEARGGNFEAILLGETRDIQLQTPEELRVALSARLSRGGQIDACFHVFLARTM